MPVPLVDLKAQYQALEQEVLARIQEVLRGMHLFLGENVEALEREFAAYCGARYGVGVGSGTDALHLALRAVGVGPGDEVITVAHTFVATAEAIVQAGARPVFVDIDPVTCTMDPRLVEAAVTAQTRAIVPVHLYGHPADMDPLLAVARRYGLRVVEDACQAHGASYRSRAVGALGDAGCFSFYYSKNLGAYGEGGMVVTSDEEVARQVRALRDHGSHAKYLHNAVGFNARLDELQAAILRVKLPHLEAWNGRRRALAAEYSRRLASLPLTLPVAQPWAFPVYHLYVVRTPQRDALYQWLHRRGVMAGIHYPVPIHLQAAFAGCGFPEGSLPETEAAAREVLSLPMYPELTPAQVDEVVEAVQEFFAAEYGRGQEQGTVEVAVEGARR